ncbi:MAG: M48 family metallopeptidase [Gammaproteobacteria bacterium]
MDLNKQTSNLLVSDINIQVVRKNVKNINFSVRASDGRVRVSAPHNISNHDLHIAVSSKIEWIQNKVQRIESCPKLLTPTYQSGEKISYLGREYILKVSEQIDRPHIVEKHSNILQMYVYDNTSTDAREKLLYEWYRAKLKKMIPELINKWQPIVGENVLEWRVKRMKTRWGTCNIPKRRIWLNLELAKKSEACLEYVVVHEMAHLLERNHNARFKRLMDDFLPAWRETEQELNVTNRVYNV